MGAPPVATLSWYSYGRDDQRLTGARDRNHASVGRVVWQIDITLVMALGIWTLVVDGLAFIESLYGQTVRIGWQGEWRELDLGEKNLNALSKGFDRFWEAARPVRSAAGSGRRDGHVKRSNGGRDPRAIRTWASENGIAVPARGRIP